MNNRILTAMALIFMAVACTHKVDEPLRYGELGVALSGEPSVEVLSKALLTLMETAAEGSNSKQFAFFLLFPIL